MTVSESADLPVLTDLSARETELVHAARHGEVWVCSDLSGEALARSTNPQYRVRSRLIRELLLGRHGDLDPQGVRVKGARIVGQLNLDNIDTTVGLGLVGCALTKPMTARGAHLPRLILVAGIFDVLHADRLRVDGDVTLEDARFTGRGEDGTIRLCSAHIGGQLDGERMQCHNPAGPALDAEGLQMDGSLFLRNARFVGSGELGAVRLRSARIGGQLDGERMQCHNPAGPALHAENLRVEGDLFLDARFTGSGESGAVRLWSAHIGGQLAGKRMQCHNPAGPALHAENLRVEGDLILEDARFTGSGESGTVRLRSVHIGGLNGVGMRCHNTTGPALHADGLRVDDSLILEDARFTGSGESGMVRLHSAHIGGQLAGERMQCHNTTGPALLADGLRVDDSLILKDARFTGSGESGAVRLWSVHIGGQLTGKRMQCHNTTGPALLADGLRVDGSLLLDDALLTGSSAHDAIRLYSARIDGQLSFIGAHIFNGTVAGLELQGATVAETVFFPAGLVCPQPWGRSCPCSRRIGLTDFTFGSLDRIDWKEWLHLIRFHTDYYFPAPYQQLAAVERAAGHDGNARRILIAQQQDLLRRAPGAVGGALTRGFHRLWGALAGYGYRTRRTAAALLLALTAAAVLGLWAGHVDTHPGYAAERTATSGAPGTRCSPVELIGLGLDRGLPLGPTGLRTRCDLDTATTAGQWFTVAVWVIQAAVWGLATLALVGYTGLIRKTS